MSWKQFFIKLAWIWAALSSSIFLILSSIWMYRLSMNLPTMKLNIGEIFYVIWNSISIGGLLTMLGLTIIVLIALIKSKKY